MTSDRSGNRRRSAFRRCIRNFSSAAASGSGGSFAPYSAATATIFCQRSGDRTTRRSDAMPLSARNRAVTPLAAIMKSLRAILGNQLAVSTMSSSPSI